MTPEGLLMLVLIIIGLGGLALYLRVKIYLMDRREGSSLRDVGETVEAYDANFERSGQRAPIVIFDDSSVACQWACNSPQMWALKIP